MNTYFYMRLILIVTSFHLLTGFSYEVIVIANDNEQKTYRIDSLDEQHITTGQTRWSCFLSKEHDVGTTEYPGVRKRFVDCKFGEVAASNALVCGPGKKELVVLHLFDEKYGQTRVGLRCL